MLTCSHMYLLYTLINTHKCRVCAVDAVKHQSCTVSPSTDHRLHGTITAGVFFTWFMDFSAADRWRRTVEGDRGSVVNHMIMNAPHTLGEKADFVNGVDRDKSCSLLHLFSTRVSLTELSAPAEAQRWSWCRSCKRGQTDGYLPLKTEPGVIGYITLW